jgi:hypothetical protein
MKSSEIENTQKLTAMESRFTAVQPRGLALKSMEIETQSSPHILLISVCVQVGTEKKKKKHKSSTP